MPISREVMISRRAVLAIATTGGAASLVLRPDIALASAPAASIEKSSGDIDAYLAATSATGVTSLSGIHDEYRRAIAIFPFELPPGQDFPPESSLKGPPADSKALLDSSRWERGCGVAEVYMLWQCAVARAAVDAHQRGDVARAEDFLNSLISGYQSAVRRAVLSDPDDRFLRVELVEAQKGEFAAFSTLTIT